MRKAQEVKTNFVEVKLRLAEVVAMIRIVIGDIIA